MLVAAYQDGSPTTSPRLGPYGATGRRAQRGWVRGSFRLRLVEYVCGQFGAAAPPGDGVEVVIDFRKPSPAEKRADQVKALWDEGWSNTVIADRLDLNLNQVRQALVAWFELRGLPVPDNRSRRNARRAPDSWRPKYQVIAPEVMRLVGEGGSVACVPTPTVRATGQGRSGKSGAF